MVQFLLSALTVVFGVLRFALPFSGELNKRHVFRDVLHIQVGAVYGFALAEESWKIFWIAHFLFVLIQTKIIFGEPFSGLDAYKNAAHLFVGLLLGYAFLVQDAGIGFLAAILVVLELVAFVMSFGKNPKRPTEKDGAAWGAKEPGKLESPTT